jgi:hypothetical protein
MFFFIVATSKIRLCITILGPLAMRKLQFPTSFLQTGFLKGTGFTTQKADLREWIQPAADGFRITGPSFTPFGP